MVKTTAIIATSASATTGALINATSQQDNILSWVLLGVNVVVLVSNCALEIYKSWKEKRPATSQNIKDKED